MVAAASRRGSVGVCDGLAPGDPWALWQLKLVNSGFAAEQEVPTLTVPSEHHLYMRLLLAVPLWQCSGLHTQRTRVWSGRGSMRCEAAPATEAHPSAASVSKDALDASGPYMCATVTGFHRLRAQNVELTCMHATAALVASYLPQRSIAYSALYMSGTHQEAYTELFNTPLEVMCFSPRSHF